ncbi:MAG: transporter, partial [Candidatus Competibacterales bacterium]
MPQRRYLPRCTLAALGLTLVAHHCAFAAEGAVSFYLLGQRSNFAAVLPPPGVYFSFDQYFFSGEADGDLEIPDGGELNLGLEADVALSLPSAIWAPDVVLLGGRPLLVATVPFGYKTIEASAVLEVGDASPGASVDQSDFTLGDPV